MKRLRDHVKGSRLRGQGVKGLGHSIGQTITVSYTVFGRGRAGI